MNRPKLCPIRKQEYCLEKVCAWYLEWAASCAIPVAVGVMADSYRTRIGRNVPDAREEDKDA